MKLYFMLCVSLNCVRLPIIKLFHRRCFFFKPIQLISPKTTIIIENGGVIKLNGRLHSEAGVLLSAKSGNLSIGNGTYINRNSMIVCRTKINIGDNSTIGPNVMIFDHDHDIYNKNLLIKDKIIIGKNVWIGAGSIILKGVSIGDNCVIAAGTTITKDIPANMIVRDQIQYVYKEVIQ